MELQFWKCFVFILFYLKWKISLASQHLWCKCLFFQSQEDSDFRRSEEEVVRLNRQISDLSQASHSGSDGFSWTSHADVVWNWSSLNLSKSGKWAAADVSAASPDWHRRPALGAGQAEEHVCRPESSTRKVRLTSVKTKYDPTSGSNMWLCVSLQRNGWLEDDGCGIPVIFQSDSGSPVSLFSTWWSCLLWTFNCLRYYEKLMITIILF